MPSEKEPPRRETIRESMVPCEPYRVADITAKYDVSRWTIRDRLERLVDRDELQRKKHADGLVTYWITPTQ